MPEFVTPDIWIKGGLLAPKHRKAMGEALWLYLYIQGLVRFDGPNAGNTTAERPYRHTEAAETLGVDVRSIKREFVKLEAFGYITAQRVNHGLRVTVTKYLAQSQRTRKRTAPSDANVPRSMPSQVTDMSEPSDAHVQAAGRLRPSQVTFASPSNKEDKRTNEQAGESRAREAAQRTPAAIALYCQLRQTSITKLQADLIAATVGDSSESLDKWRRAVEACEANGVRKSNVKCALDWWKTGVPDKYRLPGEAAPVAGRAAPPRPELTPEQETASDAERERVRASLAARGLAGKYAQIGKPA